MNNYSEIRSELEKFVDTGCGGNVLDLGFSTSFLKKKEWNHAQARAVAKMLGRHGVNTDVGPEPIQEKHRRRARPRGKYIDIDVDTNDPEYKQIVRTLNSVPGRQFRNRAWSIPRNSYGVKTLKNLGIDVGPGLEEPEKSIEVIDSKEGLSLFNFQREGADWLDRNNGRGIIGDEMGLGKTIQAIEYVRRHPELRPALIVVPASIKINWKREFKKWCPQESCEVVDGRSASISMQNIVIINYDILVDYFDLFECVFKLVVLDEVHVIANTTAMRSRCVRYVCKGVDHIIGISGTLSRNRPFEFFNILNIIDPIMFPSKSKFILRYCGGDKRGASNTRELHEILTQSYMIRRLKKDVLKDLPPKIRSVIPVEISNRSEYEDAENDIISYIRENDGDAAAFRAKTAETLVRFGKLKRIAAAGKMSAVKEWIDNYISGGDKIVVGCIHRDVLEELAKYYGGIAVKLYGGMSASAKQKSVDAFQNDDRVKVFLGNVKAAGVGITLTAASATVQIELGWVPGDSLQFEDRVHRIGASAEFINSYYLVGLNTIEEDIAEIQDQKSIILGQILDGEEPADSELLTALIARLKSKYGSR